MEKPQVLVCPPNYFFAAEEKINYKINPWMKHGTLINLKRAMAQWMVLCNELEKAGCVLNKISPQQGLSDFVFTANHAFVSDGTALLSRFRHNERRQEEPHIKQWFLNRYARALICRIAFMPDDFSFEGQGDAFLMRNIIFAGYGDRKHFRTDKESHDILRAVFGKEVVSLRLIEPRFYHLDTCFRPINTEVAIYVPDAFDTDSRYSIEKHVPSPLPISKRDALKFICNAIPIGKRIIFGAEPSVKLAKELFSLGFTIVVTELDEFFKVGGSAQCLVLFL